MAVLPLLYYPSQKLKQVSVEVEPVYARMDHDDVIRNLAESLVHYRGLGLSAIQVGVPQRIFVMAVNKQSSQNCNIVKEMPYFLIQVFVNPVIVEVTDGPEEVEEGCLSLPGIVERVRRYRQVVVEGDDITSVEMGRRRWDLEGIEAQCAQHEIDHLDGKLFSDGFKPVKRDITKRKVQKALREMRR